MKLKDDPRVAALVDRATRNVAKFHDQLLRAKIRAARQLVAEHVQHAKDARNPAAAQLITTLGRDLIERLKA